MLTFIVTRVFTRLALMVDQEFQYPAMQYEADIVLHGKTFDAGYLLPLNHHMGLVQVLGIDVEVIGSPSTVPFFSPTIWYEPGPRVSP